MMKFTSAVSFLVISWPFVMGQQCPFGPDGLISGTTYQVDENNSKWVILERNNGSQCPCSYVEASCKLLDGRDCSETVVDTSSAIKDPFSFVYPEIEAVYSMKLCNYNSFNMFFAPVDKNEEERNQLEFWYTQPNTYGKVNRIYLGERMLFSDDALAAGTCVSVQETISIPSRISKFYMKALLNGPHEDGFSTAYCNAYSFKPIELTYDYGDGKCDVSTKATCTVKGTNKSCEEHIRSMELSSCDSPEVFTGVFEWEACNNNNRKIYIYTNPSNRKYSTNERKSNGKFIKDSESLPPTIEANSCYVPQPVEKEINPCNSNFSQINMKGVEYNRETGLHYRDKDCRSFTFLTLPVLDPNASTSTPSESLRPTLSMAPSVHPTSKPSSVIAPSRSPVATGSDATGAPSVTSSLSPTSSTSAPSSSPFATGSDATGAPSVTSSLSPSSYTSAPSSSPFATGSDATGAPSVTSSSSPSDRPSIGQSLSPSQTVTTTPTVTPTTKAAKSPKAKSPKNSVSPTIGVTKSPKLPKGTKSPKSPKNSTNAPTYKSAKTKSPKGTKTPKAPVTTSTKTPKDPNATKSPKDPKATKSPKAPKKSTTAPKDNSTTTKSPKGTKTPKAPVTTSAKAPKRS